MALIFWHNRSYCIIASHKYSQGNSHIVLLHFKANSMILRPAINFITPTGSSRVTSCFCIEPFNNHLKVTTCNDRDNKATINQGEVSLQLTCISGNRARVSWRKRTPFSYLHKNWSLATDMVLTLYRRRNQGGTGDMCSPKFHKLLYKLLTILYM